MADQLVAVLGIGRGEADALLSKCGGSLERAVSAFYGEEDAVLPATAASGPARPTQRTRQPRLGTAAASPAKRRRRDGPQGDATRGARKGPPSAADGTPQASLLRFFRPAPALAPSPPAEAGSALQLIGSPGVAGSATSQSASEAVGEAAEAGATATSPSPAQAPVGGAGDADVELDDREVARRLRTPCERYDPVELPLWASAGSGGGCPLAVLAVAFAEVEAESGRRKIAGILTNLFAALLTHARDEVAPAIYLASNHIAPAYEGLDLNVGGSTVTQVRVRARGTGIRAGRPARDPVRTRTATAPPTGSARLAGADGGDGGDACQDARAVPGVR